MRNFRVTVNGNAYDVTVEEVMGGNFTAKAPAPMNAPTPVYVPAPVQHQETVASTPTVNETKTVAEPTSSDAKGRISVVAPMPGKILAIKVAVGGTVKKGDVVVLLEAMKMENEIVASEDGVVVSINTSVGDMVDPGQIIATFN